MAVTPREIMAARYESVAAEVDKQEARIDRILTDNYEQHLNPRVEVPHIVEDARWFPGTRAAIVQGVLEKYEKNWNIENRPHQKRWVFTAKTPKEAETSD